MVASQCYVNIMLIQCTMEISFAGEPMAESYHGSSFKCKIQTEVEQHLEGAHRLKLTSMEVYSYNCF